MPDTTTDPVKLRQPRRRTDPSASTTEKGQALTQWLAGYPDQWAEHVPELQWPMSVTTYARMATDPQIAGVLLAISEPLLDAEWALHPEGADQDIVDFVSRQLTVPVLGGEDIVRPARNAVHWHEHLETVLTEALVQGHAVFEQVYDPIPDPTVGVRLALRKLGHRPAPTIDAWNHALDGGLDSITQTVQNPGGQYAAMKVELGIDRLVVYSRKRRTGDWTGQSLLRAAWKPWFLKDQVLRIGMIGLERSGVGVPIVKYPGAGGGPNEDTALEIASNIRAGEDAGVAIGQDWEVTLQGIEGGTVDPLPYIAYFDQQIAKSVLAMFLDLGHDAGARSLGDTFTSLLMLFVNGLRRWIETTATEHVVRDLVELNFGPDALYPLIRAPRLEVAQAVTPQLVAELVKAGVLSWTPALEAQVRSQLRLTAEDEATLIDAHDRAVGIAAGVAAEAAKVSRRGVARPGVGQQSLFSDRSLEGLHARLDSLRR
jgi:hypothetical protein